jgi:hypothetical protein
MSYTYETMSTYYDNELKDDIKVQNIIPNTANMYASMYDHVLVAPHQVFSSTCTLYVEYGRVICVILLSRYSRYSKQACYPISMHYIAIKCS